VGKKKGSITYTKKIKKEDPLTDDTVTRVTARLVEKETEEMEAFL